MAKVTKEQISAKGFAIQIYTEDFKNDYISLTNIANYKEDWKTTFSCWILDEKL